jgi:hypothetical protein
MRTVYRHMDTLPWDLNDVVADVAQQDLDGRRRAVRLTPHHTV